MYAERLRFFFTFSLSRGSGRHQSPWLTPAQGRCPALRPAPNALLDGVLQVSICTLTGGKLRPAVSTASVTNRMRDIARLRLTSRIRSAMLRQSIETPADTRRISHEYDTRRISSLLRQSFNR